MSIQAPSNHTPTTPPPSTPQSEQSCWQCITTAICDLFHRIKEFFLSLCCCASPAQTTPTTSSPTSNTDTPVQADIRMRMDLLCREAQNMDQWVRALGELFTRLDERFGQANQVNALTYTRGISRNNLAFGVRSPQRDAFLELITNLLPSLQDSPTRIRVSVHYASDGHDYTLIDISLTGPAPEISYIHDPD